jgi:hypothetical protein
MKDDVSTPEEIESAKAQGWVDAPDFKGEDWKPAKEFLEVGEKISAVQKERNEKLLTDVDHLKDELEKTKATMQKFADHSEEQKKKAVEKAVKELKAEKAQAITDGDGEKVTQIEEQIEATKTVDKDTPPPEFTNWVNQNTWYTNNPRMKAKAEVLARLYSETDLFQGESGYLQILDHVTEDIKKEFPNEFINPAKDEPGAVLNSSPAPKKKTKGFDDLPSDAKAAYAEFASVIPNYSKEQYLSSYEWD